MHGQIDSMQYAVYNVHCTMRIVQSTCYIQRILPKYNILSYEQYILMTCHFRLESDFDNIEDTTERNPNNSMSPDSDQGDLYENLPTVIRQGQQLQSDGLTMQSINIHGPQPHFDTASSDLAAQKQSWDLLKGSLNFAYGPCQKETKVAVVNNPDNNNSEYTSLKEVQSQQATPALSIRSNNPNSRAGSQQSLNERFQTDV